MQKNLRARASRSSRRAPLREDIANTIAQRRLHASTHVLIGDANTRLDPRECTHSNTSVTPLASCVVARMEAVYHGIKRHAQRSSHRLETRMNKGFTADEAKPEEARSNARAASVSPSALPSAVTAEAPDATRLACDVSLATTTRTLVSRIDASDCARQ
ncbi:hypothetical protein GCM10027081_06510 [Cupriavidus yeoncheonensis]